MTEYTCDSFRFFNLFPVYFGGKGTLMQEIRYLDKLVDELAKGKAMEKVLRK